MSDAESGQYTPTTEEVRDNMAFGLAVAIDVIPDQDHRDRANAVFDRWLAAHDAEVLASRDQEVAELRAVIEKVREAVVKYEAWLDGDSPDYGVMEGIAHELLELLPQQNAGE